MRPLSIAAVTATTSLPILWFTNHKGMVLFVFIGLVIAVIMSIRNWQADKRYRATLEQQTLWIPRKPNNNNTQR